MVQTLSYIYISYLQASQAIYLTRKPSQLLQQVFILNSQSSERQYKHPMTYTFKI